MATKEDILEQIVEEYLISQGYFVQHNIKFLPRKDHPDYVRNKDSNHSDIDVLGFHPLKEGAERVMAVSCKSWQSGFNPTSEIDAIEADKRLRGRQAWQAFRELTVPKWSQGFLDAVEQATGATDFTYVTAVAKVRGDKAVWEGHPRFTEALGGNPIRILTFEEMLTAIQKDMGQTLAGSEVGRLLQVVRAAGLQIR